MPAKRVLLLLFGVAFSITAPSQTGKYLVAPQLFSLIAGEYSGELAQGSDHDIFVGLGIPSSMFGHAPDWTHHTSEDTLDKTDASEFLRVGVLATSATIWLAGATQADWDAFSNISTARKLSDYADRTARILTRGGSELTPQTPRRLQYCQNVVTALGRVYPACKNPKSGI